MYLMVQYSSKSALSMSLLAIPLSILENSIAIILDYSFYHV